MYADCILINGIICTVDIAFRIVEAIAINDETIIYCGDNCHAMEYKAPYTTVIDLKGKLVLPGTFDAHAHAAYAGLSLSPDFVIIEPQDATNLKEFNDCIKKKAEQLEKDTWIIGWGFKRWQIEEWVNEKRNPTWCDIEEGAMGHPVILNDGGVHNILVSKRALELAEITKETTFNVEEGFMFRFEDGSPTGFFTDFGTQAFIGKAATHLSGDAMDECVLRMQRAMNSYGITSHNEIAGIGGNDICFGTFGEEAINSYKRLEKQSKLTARVFVNILAGKHGIQSYSTIMDGIKEMNVEKYSLSKWVHTDSIKIFGDDDWERDTPIEQNGHCTFPGKTEEEQIKELKATVRELHKQNWQMAIHITGGKGMDATVEALCEAQKEFPGKDLRHFILHASGCSEQNLKDCVRANISCGAQAVAGYEFGGETNYKVFLDGGMLIAEGSDAPALPMSWLKGLHFLVSRYAKDKKVYNPQMSIGIREAIRMYTIYPAYQNHVEDICGSLEVGKLADLQVLDQNLFEIPANKIENIQVLMTMCGGKIVYQKDKGSVYYVK